MLSSSDKYIGLWPPNKWPKFTAQWDLSEKNFKWAFDGWSEEYFNKKYPDGLRLGTINWQEVDSKLFPGLSLQDTNIWKWHLIQPKLSNIIDEWTRSVKLTPPLVGFGDGIYPPVAGNHRLTVWWASQRGRLVFLYDPKNENQVISTYESFLPKGAE